MEIDNVVIGEIVHDLWPVSRSITTDGLAAQHCTWIQLPPNPLPPDAPHDPPNQRWPGIEELDPPAGRFPQFHIQNRITPQRGEPGMQAKRRLGCPT